MRRAGIALVILLATAGCGAAVGEGPPASADSPGSDREPAVLLELFTSQGCSSCPPADRLLRRLAREGGVIPLAFHIEYWNYIGWTDPFSSERWSARQEAYVEALGGARLYTPQLVVGGRLEMVGSDEEAVRRALAERRAAPPAGRVTLSAAGGGEGEVRLMVEGELRGAAAAGSSERLEAPLEMRVALFENGLVTEVGAGENTGRTLENDFVVRHLEGAFTLPAEAGARRREEVVIPLADPALKAARAAGRLGVAAFLQDPETMAVHGAAVLYLEGNEG